MISLAIAQRHRDIPKLSFISIDLEKTLIINLIIFLITSKKSYLNRKLIKLHYVNFEYFCMTKWRLINFIDRDDFEQKFDVLATTANLMFVYLPNSRKENSHSKSVKYCTACLYGLDRKKLPIWAYELCLCTEYIFYSTPFIHIKTNS